MTRIVNITCPGCGTPQDVELVESINAQTDPQLKEALMQNRLNRITCTGCGTGFRIDLPLLYNDPVHHMLIHWIPESTQSTRGQILREFESSLEELHSAMPQDADLPGIRLVLTRVELVELIFMLEAGLNQRVVEYIKYSIHTRNLRQVDPERFQLLLNVQDSTEEELHFVLQHVEDRTLGKVLTYGRAAYRSMSELYDESPEEFIEMFPGPCISARHLLLDEAREE